MPFGIPAAFMGFMALMGALTGYDLATNPMSPPQIFAAQFEAAFGHPPGANLPQPKRRVFLTRP